MSWSTPDEVVETKPQRGPPPLPGQGGPPPLPATTIKRETPPLPAAAVKQEVQQVVKQEVEEDEDKSDEEEKQATTSVTTVDRSVLARLMAKTAKQESSSESGSDSEEEKEEENIDEEVDELLHEVAMVEREAKLDQVEKAFKLNPLEILELPSNATVSEVKNAYRKISLLVHPDKMRPEIKERAQKAFAKLAEAKMHLLDDAKRGALTDIIVQARNQVTVNMGKAEKEKRKAMVRSKEAHVKIMNDPMPDFTQRPEFDAQVMAAMKEILIDQAWRQRQLMKSAHQEEKVIVKARKEVEVKDEAVKQVKEDWEKTREVRVTSWRDFQKKTTSGPKKRKIQTGWEEDEGRTFVRRPKKPIM